MATLKMQWAKSARTFSSKFSSSDDELKCHKSILDKVQEHFAPSRNVLHERYLFHTADQQANETVDQYVIRLRQLAEKCKFTQLETEMIRDRLVLRTKDKAARARLFRKKECDVKRAIESLRISELTQEQLKKIDVTQADTVNYVKKRRPTEHREKKRFSKHEDNSKAKPKEHTHKTKSQKTHE